jgi:hypothetical protein
VNPSTPKLAAGGRKEGRKEKMVYTLVYGLEFVVYIQQREGPKLDV